MSPNEMSKEEMQKQINILAKSLENESIQPKTINNPLENEKLVDLANNGLEISNRINELNERITNLQKDINSLSQLKMNLTFQKQRIVDELVRRKCHDIGGALTLISKGEIDGNSTEIFDRERNKVRK
jgi:hypothetical protein